MRDNGIGSDGARSLAEMLTENNYVQELDVSENKVGTTGIGAVFAMMMENTTIERLGR